MIIKSLRLSDVCKGLNAKPIWDIGATDSRGGMESVICGSFGEAIEQRVEREVNFELNQWQQDACWMVGRCMYVCVCLEEVLPDAVDWRLEMEMEM